jgi:hypothetical protein
LKDKDVVHEALRAQARIAGGLKHITVIHGACATGADAFAHQWCQFFPDVTEETYAPNWDSFGKAAGPIRNSIMVASGADVVLAFPRGEGRGTMDCVLKARQAGLPVIFG